MSSDLVIPSSLETSISNSANAVSAFIMDPNNEVQIKKAMESRDVQDLASLITPSIERLASIYKSGPVFTDAEIVEGGKGKRKQRKMGGQPNSGALVYGGGIVIILFFMILFKFIGGDVPIQPTSTTTGNVVKRKYRGTPADFSPELTPDRVGWNTERKLLGGAKSRKYRRKRTVRRR
uniref:Uncharacterized protein n=1 Tax=viral metagenome TaxID=1070528 RepID=A0A6C0B048_9ZZZZ